MLRYNYRACLQLIIIFFCLIIILPSCKQAEGTGNIDISSPPEKKIDGVEKKENIVSSPVKTAIDRFKHKPVDDYSNEYNSHFRKASKKYFGIGFDYRWFKSQGMAESGLDPDAVSPVGAKGIMQVMDPTYKEIKRKNKTVLGNVFEVRWNIEAGIYYDSYLYGQWSSPRPELDRLALMCASYNAGIGNILKAQKTCNKLTEFNCNLWNKIKSQGGLVDSWKQYETIHYVARIFRFMNYEEF